MLPYGATVISFSSDITRAERLMDTGGGGYCRLAHFEQLLNFVQ